MNNSDKDDICTHGIEFNWGLAQHMSSWQVRQKYPRLSGPCPKGCGFSGVSYASYLHYIAGDW